MCRRALAIALIGLASVHASAASKKLPHTAQRTIASQLMPADFMGVALGTTFEMKECAVQTFPYGIPPVYDYSSDKNTFPCWHALNPGSDVGRPKGDSFKVDIIPPSAKSPHGAGNASVLVVNGQIEGVEYLTHGWESQDSILQALKGKLGPPTTVKEVDMQNRMGAKFTSHEAEWLFTNGRAGFTGLVDNVDQGFGFIYTAAGAAYIEAEQNATSKDSF